MSEQAEAIHGLLAATSANVIQIGLRLQFVRDRVGRENFQPWLRKEFRWSQSVASNYMRAAKCFADLDCHPRLQPSALFILARKRCPAEARAEAVRLARGGSRVTKAVALELVALHAREEVRPLQPIEGLRRSLLRTLPKLSADQIEELAGELLEAARRMKSGSAD